MGYSVRWHPETGPELQRLPKHSEAIKRKVTHIAKNIPLSLKLRGVQPTRGLPDGYEVDVAGTRVGIHVQHEKQLLVVYLVGTEPYAYANYLKAASRRLEVRQPPSTAPGSEPREGGPHPK